MTSRLVLVDADGLLYQAGAIGESRYYECVFEREDGTAYSLDIQYVEEIKAHSESTGDELVEREQIVVPGPKRFALQAAKRKMVEIKSRYGNLMEVYVKGNGVNWRDDVATLHGYKANRSTTKPYWMEAIRQYLIDVWHAIPVDGKEADDMLATRAYEASKPVVICSPDKDLDQIPGIHWDYKKQVEYNINAEEARAFFWQQVLSGDNADNIKGCWKVGTSRAVQLAEKMLYDLQMTDAEIWEEVVFVYEESMGIPGCPYAGMPADEVALENARLVWMQTEHGVLWTPPGQPKEYLENDWDD